MTDALRLLLVEDSETDAKLVVRALRSADRPVEALRVEDAEAMRDALARGQWDVVISDWSMPRFSAPAALALLQGTGLDLPFLIVSGTVGEETAVAAMRAGAHDYLLKDKLARLAPAVERELRECAGRAARRRAEEALRASEARYRCIVETSNEGVWAIDAAARTTFINARMAQMLGRDPDEVMGRTPEDFLDERGQADLRESLELHQTGRSKQYEVRFRRKDGTDLWTLLKVSPIVDAAGRSEGALAMVMDVSERRKAEDSLRVSEARFRGLWDSGILLITISDTLGNIFDINDAGVAMLGYPREDLLAGRVRWPDLTPPEWRPAEDEALAQLATTGVAAPWEKELIRGDGSRVSIVAAAAMLEGREGIAIAVDLTARKRAEDALRSSEEAQRLLFEATPLPSYVFASDSLRFVAVNAAALALYGYSRDEFLALRLPEIIHPDEVAARVEAVRSTTSEHWYGSTRHRTRAGVTVHVEVSARQLTYGGRAARIAVVRDVTEKMNLEAQLRQAQKMEAVGRLAGGVAHDFNNILSVILGYAEMLRGDLRAGDPVRADLEEICTAGRRAADLTRQLLLFSRQQVVEPRVLDLNEILAGVDKMLRRVVGEDVELIVVPAPALGRVRVDPGSIEQVVMNLVVNARDAMPIGGKLTLETANVVLDETYAAAHLGVAPGPHVMLAVSDNGVGMDRATQARIFEPFFTTKELGKGTGLGLSTVFGIAHQAGGSVWVYSEPGVGTTFKVYLPRVDGALHVPGTTATRTPRRGSETVLLVEDEDQVRAVARGILRRQGYRVIEARNAGEALLLCESHEGPLDLLLTDVVMPQMSGPELARRLARERPGMRVVCMSGYTDDAVVRHGALEAGVAFLQKPFTPTTLAQKVREVLDAPRGG